MSRPRFLADENLREAIVTSVERLDPTIDFSTVQALGLRGTSDPDLIEFAERQGWIIVTHDVSTMTACAYDRMSQGAEFAGVLLSPQACSTREIAESLVLIAGASDSSDWRNQVVFLPV